MQIIVYVRPEVARHLHQGGTPTRASRELKTEVRKLGVTLKPMHPGVDDASLQSYFTIEVPGHEAAQEVIAKLQKLRAVDGAYVKPMDEYASP